MAGIRTNGLLKRMNEFGAPVGTLGLNGPRAPNLLVSNGGGMPGHY